MDCQEVEKFAQSRKWVRREGGCYAEKKVCLPREKCLYQEQGCLSRTELLYRVKTRSERKVLVSLETGKIGPVKMSCVKTKMFALSKGFRWEKGPVKEGSVEEDSVEKDSVDKGSVEKKVPLKRRLGQRDLFQQGIRRDDLYRGEMCRDEL